MFGDFKIIKKCKTTNARVSEFTLEKNTLHLPIFMPVATYGAMRGVKANSMDEEIILSNTYHLRKLGRNIKEFMGWNGSMLTDSGGFQIQSLPNVQVTDEGVLFDNIIFTPENSMDIQMTLGADIMMQLDDVVNPKEERCLHEKAIERSIEWLDRAIVHINNAEDYKGVATNSNSGDISNGGAISNSGDVSNGGAISNGGDVSNGGCAKNSNNVLADSATISNSSPVKKAKTIPTIKQSNGQVLFPIIQGGLLDDLRKKSIDEILLRKPLGLAIGGLSGGEDKNQFCSTVLYCCTNLPSEMPRYLMGVGYPEDIVVCCALGTDMSDCVYPTRTARFGRAFRDVGDLMIDGKVSLDLDPIDKNCGCSTCASFSRSYLSAIKSTPNFCMLMSVHNLFYMRNLTLRIRESIMKDLFPEFIVKYMGERFQEKIPEWIIRALDQVNVKFE